MMICRRALLLFFFLISITNSRVIRPKTSQPTSSSDSPRPEEHAQTLKPLTGQFFSRDHQRVDPGFDFKPFLYLKEDDIAQQKERAIVLFSGGMAMLCTVFCFWYATRVRNSFLKILLIFVLLYHTLFLALFIYSFQSCIKREADVRATRLNTAREEYRQKCEGKDGRVISVACSELALTMSENQGAPNYLGVALYTWVETFRSASVLYQKTQAMETAAYHNALTHDLTWKGAFSLVGSNVTSLVRTALTIITVVGSMLIPVMYFPTFVSACRAFFRPTPHGNSPPVNTALQSAVAPSPWGPPDTCESCNQEPPILRCNECQITYCKNCFERHHRSPAMLAHSRTPLPEAFVTSAPTIHPCVICRGQGKRYSIVLCERCYAHVSKNPENFHPTAIASPGATNALAATTQEMPSSSPDAYSEASSERSYGAAHVVGKPKRRGVVGMTMNLRSAPRR
ncbi:hypothetical protein PAPYR_4143 [Paratrimastix pyriformis]|uniref:B box-type domain-containing protein n=1 Tax=Paratrimastix pyriformis TaxID=342808 RepID=A0ABQ8USN0_9EUKA|nr:hypothetical protein PAPYR_4143 [Paratrimastix pyriformis]